MRKRWIGEIVLVALLGVLGSGLWAQEADGAYHRLVQGAMVVNFCPEAKVSLSHAEDVVVTGLASVDVLNRRYGVFDMRPEFPGAAPATGPGSVDLSGYYILKFPREMELEEILTAYEQDPHVEHVEPIGVHPVHEAPNDPFFNRQWALYQSGDHDIDAVEAWDVEKGDSTVLLAIVDTGVLYSHPDLGGSAPYIGGNIWINWPEYYGAEGVDDDGNTYVDDVYGWDFVDLTGDPPENPQAGEDYYDQDSIPSDFNGHGTHCAGIAAAITNNFVGVAGVAGGWTSQPGCRIICLRVGWSEDDPQGGHVEMDFCAQAIRYAADKGATAINCSWGSSNSGGLGAAVNYALSKGVVFCVSAGNDNSQSGDYLTYRTDCITVAATDHYDHKASYSNYGYWIDVCAPGGDFGSGIYQGIYNTFSNEYSATYRYLNGTSMAAPHVTGLAGLIKSLHPSWDRTQIIPEILDNADDIDALNPGYEGKLGSGRINARASLDTTESQIFDSLIVGQVGAGVGQTGVHLPVYARVLGADSTDLSALSLMFAYDSLGLASTAIQWEGTAIDTYVGEPILWSMQNSGPGYRGGVGYFDFSTPPVKTVPPGHHILAYIVFDVVGGEGVYSVEPENGLGDPSLENTFAYDQIESSPVLVGGSVVVGGTFIRGDVQADGDHDIFDAIYLLNWLGGLNPLPSCISACDVQDDDDADIFDAIYLLNWLGGLNPPPPAPCCAFPDDCGSDPTSGATSCLGFEPCGWTP